MNRPRILVACEFSGRVRDAFAGRGFDAWSCDLLPTESPGQHIQDDVLKHLNDGWDMMIAHPPCTYLSYAGIGWFNEDHWGDKALVRKAKRQLAYDFFVSIYDSPIEHIAIENPSGYMNAHFRKPDQIIHPFFFGEDHVKRTCLWLRNLPRLSHDPLRRNKAQRSLLPVCDKPEPLMVQKRRPGKWYSGGEEKKRYFTDSFTHDPHIRSVTFQGIADAMAAQWGKYLLEAVKNGK